MARILARALRDTASINAVSAVTLTPLMGFVVGDKRPSAAASALHLLVAVIFMAAAVAVRLIDQVRTRRARAAEIYRRAAARGAGLDPDDRFAAGRKQAHAAGLPWIEADGTVSWPARTEARP